MKKRITALLTALLVTLFCLPFSLFATGTVVDAFYYRNDDLGHFGPNQKYVIVPCNAENSALTFDTPAEDSKSTKFYLNKKDEYYTNQVWIVRKVDNYYVFECKDNGKVIDVPGGIAQKDKALQAYDYNESNAQYWRLESMDDGSYIIHSKLNDSLCWDMQGASNADGTNKMPEYGCRDRSRRSRCHRRQRKIRHAVLLCTGRFRRKSQRQRRFPCKLGIGV